MSHHRSSSAASRMPPRLRPRVLALLVVGVLASGVAGDPAIGAGLHPARTPIRAVDGHEVLELLAIQTSADRRFVDTAGREVLLRGVNVNSLGEYWQGVPELDPTIPVTDDDWDRMAAHGFSVVRLLITWSRVEPTRGTIDQAYLDQVEAAVDAAAARGIYSVIDMHQDAYTAFLSTTDPAACPPGTSPAKGWDGAPEWAVLDDGLSTCLENEERNSSPAVNRAWNNFYDDVDGIRTRFAETWGAVAGRFAGRAEVAGYDVLNEPENPRPAVEMQPVYEAFLADVISEIRAAEAGAAFDHVVFIEPAIPAGDQTRGLVIPDPAAAGIDTRNLSASVHNYAESIGDPLGAGIEGTNAIIDGLTTQLGVPNWGGEWGFWAADAVARTKRYTADEDRLRWGGAWWQWRQACGDPHTVYWEGSTVVSPPGCDDSGPGGPREDVLAVLARSYPRATPGRLDELVSDPDSGRLRVEATADEPGGRLVVWSPAIAADLPVTVRGLAEVEETAVDGGRIITATVTEAGCYALWLGEPDEGAVCEEGPAAPSGGPVSGAPSFTG